ncbi:MAG: DNA recombination protein RmuC [Bacteroidaceae bacterium]|nr:DNA recombination protein RmuC [Bacteroidaceae bacterium]
MEIAIYIVVGIVIGAIVGTLVANGRKSGIEAQVAAQSADNERLAGENERLKAELGNAIDERQSLSINYEVLKSSFEDSKRHWQAERETLEANHRRFLDAKEEEHKSAIAAQEKRHGEAMESMKETFNQTVENLKANMKAATEDMLKSRQQEFSDLSQRNIKGIVDPLNETIERMKQAMEGYSKEQSKFSGAMQTGMETIIRQTETARQSAVELTTALKHDTKVQGDYGEVILDEMLSKQGFTRGVHYELQYTMRDESGRALKDEEGGGLRPDVIFHLDRVRDVIIDSKMNLTEFIAFANAETEEERKEHLEKHVRAIEKQVKLLSQKNYFKYHEKTSSRMDYVIMFVPISAAWWEALRHKPGLWREAMDSNVYIADEQTLFAALRIIHLTWTQIGQVESQQEIFGLVNEMIERVGQFMKHYTAIGDALAKAQKAYEDGDRKLSTKGQSILTTTSKLLKKGGQDSKKHPVSPFLDIDDVEQLPAPAALPELPEDIGDA